jgi:alcohol dehydrogenase
VSELADAEVRIAVEAVAFGRRDLDLAGVGEAPGGGVVGRVIATGAAATEWDGRRVALPRLLPCGECHFCRRAAPEGCPDRGELGASRPGGLAGEIRAPARWLAPADGELAVPAAAAAILGDDALLVYTLYCRAGVAPGEPAVILGAGPRSAIATAIAESRGARTARAAGVEDLADVAERDGFAARPWRLFVLDRDRPGPDLDAFVPRGSTIAAAGPGSISVGPSLTAVTAELGHPDLLPELIALAATQLDLEGIALATAADDLAKAAAGAFAAGRIPVAVIA